MQYLGFCCGFHWYIYYLYSTQATEQGVELWHQPYHLVRGFILWLFHYSSSLLVSSPQVLLCPIWPRSVAVPLWLFPFCLHSSISKFYVIGGYFVELLESCRLINHFTLVLSLALGSILRSMATLFTVSVSCSLGDSEMGGCWCSWLHVCHICCS